MTNELEHLTAKPMLVGAGESRTGATIRLMGQDILMKARGQDTNGNFAVSHLMVGPMCGPPLHMHTREDEWFYVVNGELTIEVDGQRMTAGPGASVFAPRGIPHTFQNFTSSVVEALVMMTPAGFEDFFTDAAKAAPDELVPLFERYGMALLGPPLGR